MSMAQNMFPHEQKMTMHNFKVSKSKPPPHTHTPLERIQSSGRSLYVYGTGQTSSYMHKQQRQCTAIISNSKIRFERIRSQGKLICLWHRTNMLLQEHNLKRYRFKETDSENEEHFLFHCTMFNDIRGVYVKWFFKDEQSL